MVKVQANAVSAADDLLVAKLQKEVQHLKDILNLNRRGGVLDVNQQLLALKEENSRLKDAAGKVELVERLRTENRSLRLEMQELRANSTSDGAFKAIGFKSGTGGYGATSEANADTQSAYKMGEVPNGKLAIGYNTSEHNANVSPRKPDEGGFFMTEAENFQFDASPRPHPGQLAIPQSDAGYRHQVGLSTDPRGSGIRALPGPPGLEQQRITEIKHQASRSQNKMAAKGRCPKCTLKPPCKHYDSLEALLAAHDTSIVTDGAGLGSGMFYPDTSHS